MNTQQPQEMPAGTAEIAVPTDSEIITRLRAEIGELRRRGARESVVRRLEDAGARSPELLFGSVADKLQLADDGSVENAAAIVELLKRELPEQFGPVPSPVSIDAGSGANANARPLTKEALAKMSPEQISRLDWAAVRQVLSQA